MRRTTTRVTLEQLPDGDLGTGWTVRRMREYANDARSDPRTRAAAVAITEECGGRAVDCQILAIRKWLDAHIRFIRDPAGLELLHRPDWQLLQIAKKAYISVDCDDVAVLAAALGKAIGIRARYVVIGFQGGRGPFAHVYTELYGTGGRWREIDITRSRFRILEPNKFSVVEV